MLAVAVSIIQWQMVREMKFCLQSNLVVAVIAKYKGPNLF